MTDLNRRLARLEEIHPDRPPVVIFFITRHEPPVSEEECERAKREAIERNPGQPAYGIFVPPREGQDEP